MWIPVNMSVSITYAPDMFLLICAVNGTNVDMSVRRDPGGLVGRHIPIRLVGQERTRIRGPMRGAVASAAAGLGRNDRPCRQAKRIDLQAVHCLAPRNLDQHIRAFAVLAAEEPPCGVTDLRDRPCASAGSFIGLHDVNRHGHSVCGQVVLQAC